MILPVHFSLLVGCWGCSKSISLQPSNTLPVAFLSHERTAAIWDPYCDKDQNVKFILISSPNQSTPIVQKKMQYYFGLPLSINKHVRPPTLCSEIHKSFLVFNMFWLFFVTLEQVINLKGCPMPNLTISPHWEGDCHWKEKSRPIGRQVGYFFGMTNPSFYYWEDSYLLGGF
jgi:hypothetical protein